MDILEINNIKLSNEVVNILNKEKYTHKYKDIRILEKNRNIRIKLTDEKIEYNREDYAGFEVYYKIGNKISLFKKDEIGLNYKIITKIYVQLKELF